VYQPEPPGSKGHFSWLDFAPEKPVLGAGAPLLPLIFKDQVRFQKQRQASWLAPSVPASFVQLHHYITDFGKVKYFFPNHPCQVIPTCFAHARP